MQTNFELTPRKSFALEALFTPDWSAIYDPLSRDRWDASALLDRDVFDALCAKELTPKQEHLLSAAELVLRQPYFHGDINEWTTGGWTDALRHYLHTNFLPKLDYGTADGWREDFCTMRQKVNDDPPPQMAKRYEKSPFRVHLKPEQLLAPLHFTFKNSPQGARQRQTGMSELATLLVHVFGVSGHKTLAVTGRHLRKTSPSGGSRHPTEAYAVVFDIDGLEPGIYHFCAENHELELLSKGDMRTAYQESVLGLNRRLHFSPRVAIVLTSIVERSMHRYRDSRSYRVLHFDVGHLLMSSQLVARALCIPYLSAYSIADGAAEKLLCVDGLMETAMTQILLG